MKRRTRWLVAVPLVAGAVTIGTATGASAAGGCSRTFFISSPALGDEFADRNGDGLICVKGLSNFKGGNSVVGGFVVIDNR